MRPEFNDLSVFTSFAVEAIFYVLLFIFAIHALFLAYHWFSYGSSKTVSLLALAIYLSGGAILLLAIASAMLYI